MVQEFSLMLDIISAAFAAVYLGKLLFEHARNADQFMKKSLLDQQVRARAA